MQIERDKIIFLFTCVACTFLLIGFTLGMNSESVVRQPASAEPLFVIEDTPRAAIPQVKITPMIPNERIY